jgi:hypothetical protein
MIGQKPFALSLLKGEIPTNKKVSVLQKYDGRTLYITPLRRPRKRENRKEKI